MQATAQKNDFLTFDERSLSESLIDSNWRQEPMQRWEDVYEELCKDLGHHYGLNDIREAQ